MAIVIRKFDFDMSEKDANTYARNKTITRILNSFSLLLPAGERYFIESVRAYRDDVDEEFQERINLFIRQEGQHGAQHRKLNKMLNGVDLKVCDNEALEILQKYGVDKEHALLVTATLERYTGLMGFVLPALEKVIFPKDSEIANMWKLHALEEREHFDVSEEMKEQINLFVRQEAQHGKEHRKLNEFLDGVDLKVCDKEALEILNRWGVDKEHALLVTVTLERYTGLMGVVLPLIENWLFPSDNEYSKLWIEHGREELEHIPVGERLMKEECDFGLIKQGLYMGIAGFELGRIVWKNYRRLKNA